MFLHRPNQWQKQTFNFEGTNISNDKLHCSLNVRTAAILVPKLIETVSYKFKNIHINFFLKKFGRWGLQPPFVPFYARHWS